MGKPVGTENLIAPSVAARRAADGIRALPADFRADIVATNDVAALRRTVLILRARSKKPKSITLNVICGVLADLADKIERGDDG